MRFEADCLGSVRRENVDGTNVEAVCHAQE
jgi:hypothetical protein